MARTTTTTLRRVRRFLLAGVLVLVAAIVALYLLGRERPGGLPPIAGEQGPTGEIVQIGRGFHRFEVTDDGQKLFDIEADRILSHESELYVLEKVKITVVRNVDSTYTMTADSGSYNINLNEASLTGNVEILSNDGLSLTTEGLELRRKGRVVVSSAPVRIDLGGHYFGVANRLEFLFPSNRLSLAGKVELGTTPGSFPAASLRAQRAVFFRDTHNFVAEGNVELRREDDLLKARRLSVNFDDADRKILFAIANWDVEATLRQLDGRGMPSTAFVSGSQLSVVFDPATGEPERLEIDAPDGGPAHMAVVDALSTARILEADYVWAEFAGGNVERAQGLGEVSLDEGLSFAPGAVLRRICSDTVDAAYDATGSLTNLKLAGDVSYYEPTLQAAGDELTAEGDDGAVDLIGEVAWIATPQGRLEAPRIHLDRGAGTAEATGGVRAEMAAGSGAELAAGGEAKEPVRIEAERADWTAEPQKVAFQGGVRAWQEENFLVSESLGLEGKELIADGGVRSVWRQRTRGEDADESPPVTVSSSRMRYHLDEGRVVYDGNARIVQGGRSMSCPRLQLEVNEDDEFERMYCEGGSQIIDADGGSNISGDAAIYNTDAGKVKIVGDPVRLIKTEGGTISARLMVYDFATAIAEIDSIKDEIADLFMSSSEYFKQFGYGQPGSPAQPPGLGGTETAIDPLTGLPVAIAEEPQSPDAKEPGAQLPDTQTPDAQTPDTQAPTDPPASGAADVAADPGVEAPPSETEEPPASAPDPAAAEAAGEVETEETVDDGSVGDDGSEGTGP